jgi:hypothetical protein
MTPNSSLLINSAHGIYIPKLFADWALANPNYVINMDAVKEDLQLLLQGPDGEEYHDTWSDVTDNIKLKDDEGRECFVYQDSDVWAVPQDESDQLPEY